MVYPEVKFWKIASQYPIKVVVGYDAHHPLEFDNQIDVAVK